MDRRQSIGGYLLKVRVGGCKIRHSIRDNPDSVSGVREPKAAFQYNGRQPTCPDEWRLMLLTLSAVVHVVYVVNLYFN
jgi:hypothetical protein